jgi:hypothetical protein
MDEHARATTNQGGHMAPDRHCQACGMLCDDAGEFHPYAFCVWKRAGLDPWQQLKWIEDRLGRPPLGKKPPLIRNMRAAA